MIAVNPRSRPPSRPVLRYHGGKFRLRKWIIGHFPPHRVYVEPYGGAGSVLMAKPRAFAEVYNDLDEDIVNVFRVLRDPEDSERLRQICELTPFSRREFLETYEATPKDPIERARRKIFQGWAAYATTSRVARRTTFRAKTWRRSQTAADDWAGWPAEIPAFVERLKKVTIECRPALEVIQQQDAPEVLFYLDPPYPLETRTNVRNKSSHDSARSYAVNLTDGDHRELADVVHSLRGMVVLSSYPCHLYDRELYPDWKRITRATLADGGVRRTEVLYLNARAVEARGLFAEIA